MTQETKHTPLGFHYVYNALHNWRNGVKPDKEVIERALKANCEVYEQRAELLEALEGLLDCLCDSMEGQERLPEQWHNANRAARKARGQSC